MTQPSAIAVTASRSWLSEAVTLASIPVLGYLYAFLYEYGYLTHFGLPSWLIQVGVAQLAVVAILLFIGFLTVHAVFQALPAGPYWGLLSGVASIVIPVATIAFVLALVDWTSRLQILWGVSGSLFMFWLGLGEFFRNLVFPLYQYDGPLLERWAQRARKRAVAEEADKSLADALWDSAASTGRFHVRHLFPLWLVLVVVPNLAYYGGKTAASVQQSWFVRATAPACIAIRRYEVGLVCVRLVRNQKSTLRRFEIIPPSTPATLERRMLGRLAPL